MNCFDNVIIMEKIDEKMKSGNHGICNKNVPCPFCRGDMKNFKCPFCVNGKKKLIVIGVKKTKILKTLRTLTTIKHYPSKNS